MVLVLGRVGVLPSMALGMGRLVGWVRRAVVVVPDVLGVLCFDDHGGLSKSMLWLRWGALLMTVAMMGMATSLMTGETKTRISQTATLGIPTLRGWQILGSWH